MHSTYPFHSFQRQIKPTQKSHHESKSNCHPLFTVHSLPAGLVFTYLLAWIRIRESCDLVWVIQELIQIATKTMRSVCLGNLVIVHSFAFVIILNLLNLNTLSFAACSCLYGGNTFVKVLKFSSPDNSPFVQGYWNISSEKVTQN